MKTKIMLIGICALICMPIGTAAWYVDSDRRADYMRISREVAA